MSLVDNHVVVAVDFDGTITLDSHIGGRLVLNPGCREVLHDLHKNGVSLVLWTCRTDSWLQEALSFLDKEDLLKYFSSINSQADVVKEVYGDNARKVGADYYIDDKNIFQTRINWFDIRRHFEMRGVL